MLSKLLFFVLILSSHLFASDSYDEPCDELCTFVLKAEKSDVYKVINDSRAEVRLTPFSTFKIPNTLIALDLGVVGNLKEDLTFDPKVYPVQEWWPSIWYEAPITIREAFQSSAVPIYQQIASQIGAANMSQYLSKFDYGNQDMSSGIDVFWLNASLTISAKEQVDFLQRLFQSRFSVSEQIFSELKQIMLVEQTEDYRLYAKTGGGMLSSSQALGWYVGVVETATETY